MEAAYLVTGICEGLSILFQIIIFHTVYSATNKKAEYSSFVLCWIVLNPIQVLGGFSHLGGLSDCLFYLIIMLPLVGDAQARSTSMNVAFNIIASYFDPRLIPLLIPMTVIQSRMALYSENPTNMKNLRLSSGALSRLGKRAAITLVSVIIVHGMTISTVQWNNTRNILLARDPNENLGLYWYLLSVMFEERITFFRYVLVIM